MINGHKMTLDCQTLNSTHQWQSMLLFKAADTAENLQIALICWIIFLLLFCISFHPRFWKSINLPLTGLSYVFLLCHTEAQCFPKPVEASVSICCILNCTLQVELASRHLHAPNYESANAHWDFTINLGQKTFQPVIILNGITKVQKCKNWKQNISV